MMWLKNGKNLDGTYEMSLAGLGMKDLGIENLKVV